MAAATEKNGRQHESPVNGREPTRGIVFTEDVVKIPG
jgi:hypothetical protein